MGDTHVLQAKENFHPALTDHFPSVRKNSKELMISAGLHTTREHFPKGHFIEMFSMTTRNKDSKIDMPQMDGKLQNKEGQVRKLKRQHESHEDFDDGKPQDSISALTQRCTNKSPASGGNMNTGKVVRFLKDYDGKSDKGLEEENKNLGREVERLRYSVRNLEEEKKGLKTQLRAAYENSSPDVRNRMSIADDEKDELRRSNQMLKHEIDRLTHQVTNLTEERFDMKRRYEDLKSCYDTLETLSSNKFSDYSIESMPRSDLAKSTQENSDSKPMFGQNGKSRGQDSSLSSIRANAELNDLSFVDCRKLISEILDIYKIRNPAHIIASIHKTEKVIQAIPRLRKFISEIAALVLPRVGLEKEMDQVELILPCIKKCFKELEEAESLKGMRKKLIKMLDLNPDCTNVEILKKVDNVVCVGYQSTDLKTQRSQRDISDKALVEAFTKTFGVKPDANVFKQMSSQIEDLKYFTNFVKQKLSLNFTLKSETCLKYVLRLLENSMKDREAADIALMIQKTLNCKLEMLPAKVEELVAERHKHNPYGFQAIH